MREEIARNAIKQVALAHNETYEQVYADIEEALAAGRSSQKLEERAAWKEIPCEGDFPTPEEFILYAVERLRNAP